MGRDSEAAEIRFGYCYDPAVLDCSESSHQDVLRYLDSIAHTIAPVAYEVPRPKARRRR